MAEVNNIQVNIGCGATPTVGWLNFDNSFCVRWVKIPIIPKILYKMRFFGKDSMQFIKVCRSNNINYCDAREKLPFKNNSVDVIYSCHMIEHLDRDEVGLFLNEAFRVLKSGGIIRLVVPDLRKEIIDYLNHGDADKFISQSLMAQNNPKTFLQKLRLLLFGFRNHLWLYDSNSLKRLILSHGFGNIKILNPGETTINLYGNLNLYERPGSIYLEARKT